MKITDDITYLRGVGPKRAEAFNKAGIFTVYDLITHFPRTYLDFSSVYDISDAPLNENVCVKAYVGSNVREHYIRRGMTTYSFDVTDGRGVMDVIFFNNKYDYMLELNQGA